MLFLSGKRCRDLSDSNVFEHWAQRYVSARLSAEVEYRGAILAAAVVCEV